MDLNYLFRREQISLVNAQRATESSARAAHAGLARGYAGLIANGHSRYRFRKAPAIPPAL
ncbi:hypothetical protein [Sphingomonas sp. 28-63-12]|uniref:hypothetical protein n=1 Tax=Sphingomonas sp. 28-63-12 TaxID=1970434 RepID=UPI000BCBDF37|nr:MAG: hypothetical protein B7Y47_16870 [Sphingomonas sp. 28-63-12]